MNLASDWNDYQILDMANGENIQEVILVEVPGIIIKNYLQHGK